MKFVWSILLLAAFSVASLWHRSVLRYAAPDAVQILRFSETKLYIRIYLAFLLTLLLLLAVRTAAFCFFQ